MMNRNASIDIAKGLVITLVVLGHVLEGSVLYGEGASGTEFFYKAIYLVHMPFWFLLSGWLFKTSQEPAAYFRKKFGHLMVPYFSWLLLLNLKTFAAMGLNLVRGDLHGEKLAFFMDYFGAQLYGGLAVHGWGMIFWFPPCLFFTQQWANWILRHFPSATTRSAWGLGAFAAGYILQFSYPDLHLPLALDVTLGALPFFLLGHALRRIGGLQRIKVMTILGLGCSLAGMALYGWPLAYHMRMGNYGIPMPSSIAAVGGFVGLLSFAGWLSKFKVSGSSVIIFGSASMTIMYLHAFFMSWIASAGITSGILVFGLALFFPTAIHWVLGKFRWTSRLFLGVVHSESSVVR